MELKGNGLNVNVSAADQSDDWLIAAANEIAEAAQERGLEIPAFAGSAAVNETTEVTSVEAAVDLREAITGQLTTSYAAYSKVTSELNKGCRKNKKIDVADEETVAAALESWLTEDKLTYVAHAQEADPELRFTLVVTPNNLVAADEVLKLGEQFGKEQPYPTYTYPAIYHCYTKEQLSGATADGAGVKFVLIPSKFTEGLYGTAEEQRAVLGKLQAENPFLRVPSVAEDVPYWETLRAQGDGLRSGDVFGRTYIRHFDLPEQRLDGDLCVPYSYVCDDGGPYLRVSYARLDGFGRVAVG